MTEEKKGLRGKKRRRKRRRKNRKWRKAKEEVDRGEKEMKAAQVCALINSDDMSASFSYARGRGDTKLFYNYFRKAAKLRKNYSDSKKFTFMSVSQAKKGK